MPPVRRPSANVYVKVPLKAEGGEDMLVFTLYNDAVAELSPVSPTPPSAPALALVSVKTLSIVIPSGVTALTTNECMSCAEVSAVTS